MSEAAAPGGRARPGCRRSAARRCARASRCRATLRAQPLTYLCGHSLGLHAARGARPRSREELDDWARLGVEGHEHARRPWIPYHENLTAGLAALTGARAAEVVAMNSLTVEPAPDAGELLPPAGAAPPHPHRGRGLLLRPARGRLADRLARARSRRPTLHRARAARRRGPGGGGAIEACLAAARRADRAGAVARGAVPHRAGVRSSRASCAPRTAHGCVAGFDLAHSIGNLPLALHDADADFAVWCSYKYLNGGPGAIGGCFVHQRHIDAQSRTRHTGALPGARLAGWWGHEEATRFLMEPRVPRRRRRGGLAAEQSVDASPPRRCSPRWRCSPRRASGRCAQKSVALTGYLEQLLRPLERQRADHHARASRAQRGCQLSLRIAGGAAARPRGVRCPGGARHGV